MRIEETIRLWALLAVTLALAAVATPGRGQGRPAGASPEVIDRVVAVVNYQPVLWSDVSSEMRFSVLDPEVSSDSAPTPQRALQQLISRTLIQQQIRQEDVNATQPTDEDVRARINEIRKELPACVRMNCATDAGWQMFLNSNELTAAQIGNYVRLRLEVLRFIEDRFRQGIRISPQETEAYYRDKLVPQYAKGARVPPLSEVARRIEEILLEEQVNAMFDNWLDNLRKQGDVEILDPALESTAIQSEGDDPSQ